MKRGGYCEPRLIIKPINSSCGTRDRRPESGTVDKRAPDPDFPPSIPAPKPSCVLFTPNSTAPSAFPQPRARSLPLCNRNYIYERTVIDSAFASLRSRRIIINSPVLSFEQIASSRNCNTSSNRIFNLFLRIRSVSFETVDDTSRRRLNYRGAACFVNCFAWIVRLDTRHGRTIASIITLPHNCSVNACGRGREEVWMERRKKVRRTEVVCQREELGTSVRFGAVPN